MQVASYFGWPVSTTHCIIGALVGFGLVYGGIGAVYWKSLARVVASWVVSPVLGAVVSFVVYRCIRTVCACQQEHFFFHQQIKWKTFYVGLMKLLTLPSFLLLE